MPWCEPCERFFNPSTLNADGTCPVCGVAVEEAEGAAVEGSGEGAAAEGSEGAAVEGSGEEEYRAPWHFRLMVVATVVYVGWRIVQLVGWGA